jgi:hypothetical protein
VQPGLPFATYRDLERAIDNGGSWLAVFSRKGDGKVTRGELEVAARSSGDPVLYLALASWRLSAPDRERVQLLLPRDLEDDRLSLPAARRLDDIAEVVAVSEPGWRVIVEGLLLPPRESSLVYAQLSGPRRGDDFNGGGKILDEVYELWELRARDSRDVPGAYVFFKRPRKSALPEGRVRLAGTVRKTAQLSSGETLRFIEPAFYTPLDDGDAFAESASDPSTHDDGLLRDALTHRVK